jgi:hypothetical protein
MPCAREGQRPLAACVKDRSPKGRDCPALAGSVHESLTVATGDRDAQQFLLRNNGITVSVETIFSCGRYLG